MGIAFVLSTSLACGDSGSDSALEIRTLSPEQGLNVPASEVTAPGMALIEDDVALTDLIAQLGLESAGADSADGVPWHPTVDFERNVVAWIHLYIGSCSARIQAITARELGPRVDVEVTTGFPRCQGVDVICQAYGFAAIERVEKPYQLVVKESPACR